MIDKLQTLLARYDELAELMNLPGAMQDMKAFTKLAREHRSLTELVDKSKIYIKTFNQLKDDEEILNGDDPELKELVKDEIGELRNSLGLQEEKLKNLLIPNDPDDDKNTILEVRSGTGGDEAAIFSGDLFRMYTKYAESRRWKVEVINAQEGEHGGYKEVICRIVGEGAYSRLKFESGAHRVQRVPETESQGRIHTSACTVAILPEADEIDEVDINPADLKVDTYRSQGAGGQHVNTTDSAVRITHVPTNTVVQCQMERSQHKNRDQAMSQLRAKLYELELQKQNEVKQAAEESKSDIGWGSQIRSYVLDQSRIKDLRTGVETGNTQAVLDGDLDQFIEASLKSGL